MKTTSRVYYQPTPEPRYFKGRTYQRSGTIVLCTENGTFLTGTCIANEDQECDAQVGDHCTWSNFRKATGIMVQIESVN